MSTRIFFLEGEPVYMCKKQKQWSSYIFDVLRQLTILWEIVGKVYPKCR